MNDFTEAELTEIESGVACGRAFDPETVARLVKALRLWNERAFAARKEGDEVAGGLSDTACKLIVAGDRTFERAVRYEAALREIIRKYGPPHPGEAYHIAKDAIENNAKAQS